VRSTADLPCEAAFTVASTMALRRPVREWIVRNAADRAELAADRVAWAFDRQRRAMSASRTVLDRAA